MLIYMNQLTIHDNILNNLYNNIKLKSIPNIIFYGSSGCGKRKLVHKYVKTIYNDNPDLIKTHVIFENCALGKGINFIRTTLKEFSKITNFNNHIKIIVLYNADKLTIDAQSAMRRCIEVFSKTTRFFIVIDNIKLLLQPIVSRFCHIYVPLPMIDNKFVNLYNLQSISNNNYVVKRIYILENKFKRLPKKINLDKIVKFSNDIYEKGYSANDLLEIINKQEIDNKYKINYIYKVTKKEIRNELILLKFLLILYYFRSTNDLENMILM